MIFRRIKKYFRVMVDRIKKSSRYLFKKTKNIGKYIYTLSDKSMKSFADYSRDFVLDFKDNVRKKGYRIYIVFIILVILIASLAIFLFLINYFFVVPVGSSAAVTRFGKYDREVEAGLHFRIPFIERYFIVPTMNLMEVTFGFVQAPVPHTDLETTAEDKYIEQYERSITRAEIEEGAFSYKGHILDSLGQKQRLPRDYIRRQLAEKAQAQAQAQTAVAVKQKPIPRVQPAKVAPEKKPVQGELKLITADLNIINIAWTLQYRVSNIKNYLFNSQDVEKNIRDISQTVMSEVIGDRIFTDVLNVDREGIERAVKIKIQKWFDYYKIGIHAEQVIILDALPVPEVIFAFNEVNKAAQDMERFIYLAEIEYLRVIPEAYGEAKRIVADAEAYAIDIVNEALGEATRFNQTLVEYQKAPQITNDRLYLEAMNALLKRTPNTILDKQLSGILPVFMGGNLGLGKIEPKTAPIPTAAPTPATTGVEKK